jgi:hypothetical protein
MSVIKEKIQLFDFALLISLTVGGFKPMTSERRDLTPIRMARRR